MFAKRFLISACAMFTALLLLPTGAAMADDAAGWISPAAAAAFVAPPQASDFDPTETASLPDPVAADADPLKGLVTEYATLAGVPASLAHAVVTIESRYNPSARNGPHFGLMQINVATARSMGFSGEPSALLDPATNLRFGMAYLAGAYRLAGGDTCGTIMRYQGGHRATRMSDAAMRYCARVKELGAARS
jgi:soluble lytic murein transglycosylase-like protein